MSTRTIAIAGSSGLIGSALVAALRSADHRVVRIVRRAATGRDELFWNPDSGDFDPAGLDGVDAVVNMCGVGVGDKRWSGAYKQVLRDSRIDPTEVISAAVVQAGVPTLVNSSAVGYYGDTRGDIVDETGLHRDTVYRLITAMLRMKVCHEAGLAKDAIGRKSIRVFALGSPPESTTKQAPDFLSTIG